MQTVYFVVRSDLRPGMQLAQAVHAAMHYGYLRAKADRDIPERVVALSTRDELELRALSSAQPAVTFKEPDLGGEMTAAALDQGKPLGHLPLALRDL